MKVIISWSGDRSKVVAEALRGWIHKVVQGAEPWMSDQDIEKGSIWPEALMEQLTGAHYGLICVTPENQQKPWISFETGAIAAKFGKSYACPLLYQMQKGQLIGPLALLQATVLEKGDFKALVKSMNAVAIAKKEKGLNDQDLDEMFEDLWPKLKAKLDAIPAPKEKVQQERDQKDVLNEVLLTVRGLAQGVSLSDEERVKLLAGLALAPDYLGFGAKYAPPSGLWGKQATRERMEALARMMAAGAPTFYECPKCKGRMHLGLIPGSDQGVYVCQSCGHIERINPAALESKLPRIEESVEVEPDQGKPKK